ncbi:MAG: glutamate cyclase domain-containing protein [Planctomycetaceae bacterium]
MPGDSSDQLEALIRRDPARRGLISSEADFGPLCAGHLAHAARHLAEFGRRVLIVTGFFIPRGDPPAAETDGPPGALLLADALRLTGVETAVVTDEFCRGAVCAAAEAQGYPSARLLRLPAGATETDLAAFLRGNAPVTHLVAVERVGPSHTLESLETQDRTGPAPTAQFCRLVPESHRDRCHNFRGEIIDEFAGDAHRLFEELSAACPQARRIGVGDGGNEIGMGVVRWEELERRLSGEHSGWLPCRVPCDWNIIAGTSNWGAYALAAAVLQWRGQKELLAPFDARQQQRVVEAMVREGPAVDGVTGRREPSVDGLPFITYIQPWEGIRRLLGLA